MFERSCFVFHSSIVLLVPPNEFARVRLFGNCRCSFEEFDEDLVNSKLVVRDDIDGSCGLYFRASSFSLSFDKRHCEDVVLLSKRSLVGFGLTRLCSTFSSSSAIKVYFTSHFSGETSLLKLCMIEQEKRCKYSKPTKS